MEKRSNCERAIGNLETPYVFRDNVVCMECWQRLDGQARPDAVPPKETGPAGGPALGIVARAASRRSAPLPQAPGGAVRSWWAAQASGGELGPEPGGGCVRRGAARERGDSKAALVTLACVVIAIILACVYAFSTRSARHYIPPTTFAVTSPSAALSAPAPPAAAPGSVVITVEI